MNGSLLSLILIRHSNTRHFETHDFSDSLIGPGISPSGIDGSFSCIPCGQGDILNSIKKDCIFLVSGYDLPWHFGLDYPGMKEFEWE